MSEPRTPKVWTRARPSSPDRPRPQSEREAERQRAREREQAEAEQREAAARLAEALERMRKITQETT